MMATQPPYKSNRSIDDHSRHGYESKQGQDVAATNGPRTVCPFCIRQELPRRMAMLQEAIHRRGRLVLCAQRVGASCRFVLRGPELGPTNRSSFATPEQSAVSMDEINPVIVEKRDQPRVSLGNALCFDAMVFRHVNDEGMWRNKTELQRNSTRFLDL